MTKKTPPNPETLSDLLTQKGINHKQVSKATASHPNTVSNWFRGVTDPPFGKAIIVAGMLGVSLKTLGRLLDHDVDHVPDDIEAESLPDLDEAIADAERALAMLKSIAEQKKA